MNTYSCSGENKPTAGVRVEEHVDQQEEAPLPPIQRLVTALGGRGLSSLTRSENETTPGGRRCEREKWGSNATPQLPARVPKYKQWWDPRMSETTKDRLPVHQNQRSQPSIVRSTEPKKRVLPDNKTHMYNIAIPKKKNWYIVIKKTKTVRMCPLSTFMRAHTVGCMMCSFCASTSTCACCMVDALHTVSCGTVHARVVGADPAP
jgi:hypothetical protein